MNKIKLPESELRDMVAYEGLDPAILETIVENARLKCYIEQSPLEQADELYYKSGSGGAHTREARLQFARDACKIYKDHIRGINHD